MTQPVAGARQRIIESNRYNPSSLKKAYRMTREMGATGATQTYKKVGDIVIKGGDAYNVTQEGY